MEKVRIQQKDALEFAGNRFTLEKIYLKKGKTKMDQLELLKWFCNSLLMKEYLQEVIEQTFSKLITFQHLLLLDLYRQLIW